MHSSCHALIALRGSCLVHRATAGCTMLSEARRVLLCSQKVIPCSRNRSKNLTILTKCPPCPQSVLLRVSKDPTMHSDGPAMLSLCYDNIIKYIILNFYGIFLKYGFCRFSTRAQLHGKPKLGSKTHKLFILGNNKHQESIQQHQKPI